MKIRDVIASYLISTGYHVLVANNGKVALEIIDNQLPDFIVLDLMLPDIPGEVLCQTIRRKYATPILMLTAKVSDGITPLISLDRE